ncbi:arf-GAP domain and FG repeat-containing protein 2 isoform X1 [Motacilla alba alba]|uniref:arf-GAP domain and FG repeat-containing protein 2 isoform X1 n=1 Tax=Motacilla alba alba TaxID=1094192 RepID=UPI0018D51B75|nr:arf-GAP domain and FG repeat-containing protein 2 isoform X1 [Motacilla alba alba]
MAAGGGGGGGPGAGPGGGPGARRGSAGRDAEAEVWCRRVRELVSAVPANRLCFECGQRGVTYVDISVGSLVCTGCSGALRGLNPPHRVKSISMTTFSEAEVLFLQAHGNEACRRVWLGTFDPRTSLLPDSRDPQKVKEFLQEKYEKKRWYVAPEQVKEQGKPPRGAAAEPPQLLRGDAGTLPQVGPAPSGGAQGERHPLTLRCPPSALPGQPQRPAPTSWLTSGGTPSPALCPPSLPSLAQPQPGLPSPASTPLEAALQHPPLREQCPPSTSPPPPQEVWLHRAWPPLSRPQGEELLSASSGPSGTPQCCPRGAIPTPSQPPWPPDPPPTPSRAAVLLSPRPLFLGASPAPSRPMGCLSLRSALPKLPPTPSCRSRPRRRRWASGTAPPTPSYDCSCTAPPPGPGFVFVPRRLSRYLIYIR